MRDISRFIAEQNLFPFALFGRQPSGHIPQMHEHGQALLALGTTATIEIIRAGLLIGIINKIATSKESVDTLLGVGIYAASYLALSRVSLGIQNRLTP